MPLMSEIQEHCLVSLANSVFGCASSTPTTSKKYSGGQLAFEIAAKLRFAKTILLLSEIMCIGKEEIRKSFFSNFKLHQIESLFK